jgi:hypothetical protein
MPEDTTPPPRRARIVPLPGYPHITTTPSPITWVESSAAPPLGDGWRFTDFIETERITPIEERFPPGTRFEARENYGTLNEFPIGTVIEGCNNRIMYTALGAGLWRGPSENSRFPTGDLGGPYRIIGYPGEPPTPSRPRYTNGRFVPRDEARQFRVGDKVLVGPRAGVRADGSGSVASEFLNAECVIVARRTGRAGCWTLRRVGGPTWENNYIHENWFTLLRRDPNAQDLPDYRMNDRVLIGSHPITTRYDDYSEAEFANQYGTVVGTDVYGDGETYNVRLEQRNRTACIWAGGLTLIERDGEVTEAGRTAPPRPIVCANAYCNRVISGEEDEVRCVDGSTGCPRCTDSCSDCGDTHINAYDALHSVRGVSLCRNCSDHCDDCGTWYVDEGEGCPNWEDHEMPRGVHGYQHTPASMWLGGPVPKTEDGRIDVSKPGAYYIGIELEIYASYEQSAMPIYDWAEQHLGHRDAITCKEDSSVRGFEIVTQPMTPELFESVDWESFMYLINTNHPLSGNRTDEPTEHGLHVHIGRIAFGRDDVAQAAYSYLLSQGDHLERIGRRAAYHYCAKVQYPVSAHISQMGNRKTTKQTTKVQRRGIYAGRDAVNLQNDATIEVRAFRSTRNADYLRNAVRLTYIAAEYIRYLRVNKEAVSPKSLHWGKFAEWVGEHYPEAHASIAGVESEGTNKRVLVGASVTPSVSYEQ